MAAADQRKAIEGELQRLTLRVTRRKVPSYFRWCRCRPASAATAPADRPRSRWRNGQR